MHWATDSWRLSCGALCKCQLDVGSRFAFQRLKLPVSCDGKHKNSPFAMTPLLTTVYTQCVFPHPGRTQSVFIRIQRTTHEIQAALWGRIGKRQTPMARTTAKTRLGLHCAVNYQRGKHIVICQAKPRDNPPTPTQTNNGPREVPSTRATSACIRTGPIRPVSRSSGIFGANCKRKPGRT